MSAAIYVSVSHIKRLIPPRKPRKLAASGRPWCLRYFKKCMPDWAADVRIGDRVVSRRSVRRRFGFEPQAGTVIGIGSDCNIRVHFDGESTRDALWWHAAWFERVPATNRIPAAEAYRLAA